MATAVEIPHYNSTHVRSSSLSCNTHPLFSRVEDHLQRLKSSSQASSSSACEKLEGLKNLYDCVNDLLQLPFTQQAVSNNELLDGSLRLLDICGSTRDVFSQMKECIRGLESSFRRKRHRDYSSLISEVESSIVSRKRLNKAALSLLKELRKKDMKSSDDANVVRLLREAERFSFQVFESLLCFVAHAESKQTAKGWNLVLKSLSSKRVSSEPEAEIKVNELENLDIELNALIKGKKYSSVHIQNLLKQLESVESTVEEMEESLECVYRCLLRTRVSLLNGCNL